MFLKDVKSGVFREVADLEEEGRLQFHTQAQFQTSLDTLVRAGDHVLIDMENNIRGLVALDVSKKGTFPIPYFFFLFLFVFLNYYFNTATSCEVFTS